MERLIVGFHADDAGEWVAELACRHSQHVRHRPPFRLAPWVLDHHERNARIGTPLDCPLCDRAEMPDGLEVLRTTPVWDEHTLPVALRRDHRVPSGNWGRLNVERGEVRFRAKTAPPLDVVVGEGAVQAIPPEVEHSVEPLGEVRLFVEMLG